MGIGSKPWYCSLEFAAGHPIGPSTQKIGCDGPFHSCPGSRGQWAGNVSISTSEEKTETLSAPAMLGLSRIWMEKFGGFGMILGHPKFGPTYVLCLRDPFWGAICHHATFGAFKTPSSCSGTWVCLKIGYPQCWWFSITFSIAIVIWGNRCNSPLWDKPKSLLLSGCFLFLFALQLMTSNSLSESSNNTL